MLALAEAFKKADVHKEGTVSKLDEWEAKSLGVSIETYYKWKRGFEDTYRVVDDYFDNSYIPPTRRRKYSLVGLDY